MKKTKNLSGMIVHYITVNIVLASVIVLLGMELENIYGCHCGG
jgi:hypothetical protein